MNRLAVLMLLTGCLGSLTLAQTAETTLTKPERKEAAQYLDETRENFLNAIKGLSETQWKYKAAPDRWSIAEVAEHIAISEETLFGIVTERILKSPAAPEKKALVKGKETLLRQMITNRTQKVQAPEMLNPTNRWATQAELTKAFTASRAKTVDYINTTQADLRSHFSPHPVFKDLDAYQWLLLIAGHSARHTDQIKEVLADPNFPKK